MAEYAKLDVHARSVWIDVRDGIPDPFVDVETRHEDGVERVSMFYGRSVNIKIREDAYVPESIISPATHWRYVLEMDNA